MAGKIYQRSPLSAIEIDGSFEGLSGFRIEIDRDSSGEVFREDLNLSQYEVGRALELMPCLSTGDRVYLVVGINLADVAVKIIDFWNARCNQKIELVVKYGLDERCWYLLHGEMHIVKIYYGKGIS